MNKISVILLFVKGAATDMRYFASSKLFRS